MNNAGRLLDALREEFKIPTDAALAREIEVAPSVISKLRAGGKLGASVVLRIHEYMGKPVKEIRELAK